MRHLHSWVLLGSWLLCFVEFLVCCSCAGAAESGHRPQLITYVCGVVAELGHRPHSSESLLSLGRAHDLPVAFVYLNVFLSCRLHVVVYVLAYAHFRIKNNVDVER